MGNSSSSELPLAGAICLGVLGYTCLILVIVFIRYICVRQGKCQNVECGMCGKEGAPQCSQCCISCSEMCGCSAPSVAGCLNSCCPNKKLSCVDVLLCQCCLGEDNCFTKVYKTNSFPLSITLCQGESKFFDCDDFLRNFSCYEEYIHGGSCCHYSFGEFWNTCCERKRDSRKVECIEEGTQMSLNHFQVHSERDHIGHHHRARQHLRIHRDTDTDTESSAHKDQIKHVHYVRSNRRVKRFRKESLNDVGKSDEENGEESDDEEEDTDDY